LETITSTSKKDILTVRKGNKVSDHGRSAYSVTQNNIIVRRQRENIPGNFSDYLGKLNMGKASNLMVLSKNHYYYEAEDLKWVKILVNVIRLNDIREVRDFLCSISGVLPARSYFIGCFFDNKKQNNFFLYPHKPERKIPGQFDPEENGISSRFPFLNMIYSLIDFKTNKYLTKTTVNLHLEEADFKLQDITEIEELTYFCAQKVVPDNQTSS
jgi:hypothetical protein